MLKIIVWVLCALGRVCSNLHYAQRVLRGKAKSPSDFEAVVQLTNRMTPEAFNGWLRSSFLYEADGIDFSKNPLVFMYDQCGDCDDYAHLAARLLERHGYSTYILSVFSWEKREGHAVCIGTSPAGDTYSFGNWPLLKLSSNDPVVAGTEVCRFGFKSDPWFAVKFDSKHRWVSFYS